MKQVSQAFKEQMNIRTDFYLSAYITFSDGTELELGKSDFYFAGNNSYSDSAQVSSFPLGVALEKQITLSLVNDDDRFSSYDFYHAMIRMWCCFDLDNGTTEKLLFGTFTVVEPEAYGTTVTVNAVDDMYKADVDYTTSLTYPLTVKQALQDSCLTCGVYLYTTSFDNDDYIIETMPEDITHRMLWGLCAMLAGGNARMDEYNHLEIKGYDLEFLRGGFDGGRFDKDTPYSSGAKLDGGSFYPWTDGDVADGGTFKPWDEREPINEDEIEKKMEESPVFSYSNNLTVATDDVVITGVQTTIGDETYTFGEEGYILSVTNSLLESDPSGGLARIYSLISGVKFRPFDASHTAYPLAEFGDVCFVKDRKGNIYQSIVTDIGFQFYGFTGLKCSAESPIRNASTYSSEATKAVQKSREVTNQQITAYDESVQALTSLLTQSFGIFKTEDVLEDGSTVFYMHNKPTLEESQTIWKMTADAFAVSTDGGKTWNAGIDAQGNAVVNVLSAIGINFDWAKGGTLELGGYNNQNGKLTILNSTGNQVGYIDNTGVHFSAGSIDIGITKISQNGIIEMDAGTGTGSTFILKANSSLMGDVSAFLSAYSLTLMNSSSQTLTLSPSYIWLYDENYYYGSADSAHGVYIGGNAKNFNVSFPTTMYSDLRVYGSKNRVVRTKSYSDRLQYSYEMPSPMFGDIGHGIVGEDGHCYIDTDPVFLETIDEKQTYHVFLQSYSEKPLYVAEKHNGYFVVKGEPYTEFDWEIKAKQLDFPLERLEEKMPDDDYEEADYVSLASQYIKDYEQEEIKYYEEIN